LIRRLREEFGLVSAYHSHLGAEQGVEAHPTFFMNRQQHRPFHLDYCFVPEGWVGRIGDVQVGNFDQWQDSDHRPLVVDLKL
jgi:endonuclease/exonuclease/phosphatase family metal-dependent hydrolase